MQATKDSLNAIKEELRKQCFGLAEHISTAKNQKYFQVSNDKTARSSEGDSAGQDRRINFLENKGSPSFDDFYAKMTSAVSKLQTADIDSIGSEQQTPAANEFRECFDILHQAGFYNVDGKPLNFWSGPEAQMLAQHTRTSLSDADVPAIKIMIGIGLLLKDKQPELANKFFTGSSAVFAAEATGKVEVFLSAHKASEQSNYELPERTAFRDAMKKKGIEIQEPKPFLGAITVGNFHWNAELGRIQNLLNHGKVERIELKSFDRVKDQWVAINLNNKEDFKNIQMMRRDSYSASETNPNSPKLAEKQKEAFSFSSDKPRPSVTVDTMTFWKKWAKDANERKSPKAANDSEFNAEDAKTASPKSSGRKP